MAKKKGSKLTYDKVAGILALIALFIAGIVYAIQLTAKLPFVTIDLPFGILNIIANVLIVISFVMISWKALRNWTKNTALTVIYWVLVVLVIAGMISLGL